MTSRRKMDKQVLPGRSISPPRRNPSGKFIRSGQKLMIINLYKSLLLKNPTIKYKEIVEKLGKDTGIGRESVSKTLSEYKSTGTVTSPNKKKRRQNILEKTLEEDLLAIRKLIHSFWLNRQIPNMKMIIRAVNNDETLPLFSETTLNRLLRRMQFKFMVRKGKSALIEQSSVICCRQRYIRSMKSLRSEGRPIYFLDEMCINVGDCRRKLQLDGSNGCPKDAKQISTSSIPASSGKQTRLIVAHIGSSDGFVPDALLCFEAKKTTGDFHNEINEATFFEWFCKILPLLRDGAAIIMDNTSYHNVKKEQYPTIDSKKSDIVAWLKGKGEKVEPSTCVKDQLLKLVEKYRQRESDYMIDEYAKEHGCIVVRIPPYHRELNPFRLAWVKIKDYINARKANYKLADIRQLVVEAIGNVTSENWQDFICAATEEEHNIYKLDRTIDSVLEETGEWLYSSDDSDYD